MENLSEVTQSHLLKALKDLNIPKDGETRALIQLEAMEATKDEMEKAVDTIIEETPMDMI